MRRFDAVVFDLDGTLADTLGDIAAGGNFTLRQLGQPALPVAKYRYLAGQGARSLVRDALGAGDDDPRVEQGVAVFRAWQLKHGMDLTRPYEGIPALLDSLAAMGVKMTVLSNKPHAATCMMIEQVFSKWKFQIVLGHRDGHALKPDPAGAIEIAEQLALPPERCLYLGDTRVDMATAVAAGMFPVGCLWGFRDEPELRESGAKAIVGHPREVVGTFRSGQD